MIVTWSFQERVEDRVMLSLFMLLQGRPVALCDLIAGLASIRNFFLDWSLRHRQERKNKPYGSPLIMVSQSDASPFNATLSCIYTCDGNESRAAGVMAWVGDRERGRYGAGQEAAAPQLASPDRMVLASGVRGGGRSLSSPTLPVSYHHAVPPDCRASCVWCVRSV